MLEYALLIIVFTLIYNVFVFFMMKSLKNQNCFGDFESVFNTELAKISNDHGIENPLEIKLMNIHILQSNFNVDKLIISLPTHIFGSRDLLSIFVVFHELGHFHQIYQKSKLMHYLRKDFVFKYVNLIAFLLTFVIYLRRDHMNMLEIKLGLIILAILLVYSTMFNFFVINKLEKYANNYALEMSSAFVKKNKKIKLIVHLMNIRDFINVAIFPILYVMMILVLL